MEKSLNHLDKELLQLDSDIVWEAKKKAVTKERLLVSIRTKNTTDRHFSIFPFFAFVGIFTIGLVLFLNGDILQEKENEFVQTLSETDLITAITVENQQLVENKESVFLSREAIVPRKLHTLNTSGEPEVFVTKEKDILLGGAIYTLQDGSQIKIETRINNLEVDLKEAYPNETVEQERVISSIHSLLLKSGEGSKIIMEGKDFLYIITGEQEGKILLQFANEIKFM